MTKLNLIIVDPQNMTFRSINFKPVHISKKPTMWLKILNKSFPKQKKKNGVIYELKVGKTHHYQPERSQLFHLQPPSDKFTQHIHRNKEQKKGQELPLPKPP